MLVSYTPLAQIFCLSTFLQACVHYNQPKFCKNHSSATLKPAVSAGAVERLSPAPSTSNPTYSTRTPPQREKTNKMTLRDKLPELCVMLIGMAALFAWNAVITIPTYWRQRFCGSPLARYHE